MDLGVFLDNLGVFLNGLFPRALKEGLDVALGTLLSFGLGFAYGVCVLFRFHNNLVLAFFVLRKFEKIFVFLLAVFQVAALLAIFGIRDVAIKIRLMIFIIYGFDLT